MLPQVDPRMFLFGSGLPMCGLETEDISLLPFDLADCPLGNENEAFHNCLVASVLVPPLSPTSLPCSSFVQEVDETLVQVIRCCRQLLRFGDSNSCQSRALPITHALWRGEVNVEHSGART